MKKPRISNKDLKGSRVEKTDSQSDTIPETVLHAWRSRIINIFVIIVGVSAILMTIASIVDALSRPGQLANVIVNSILAFLLIALAVFRNKLDIRIRAWGVLLVPYVVGVTALTSYGLGSSGRLFLVLLPIGILILIGVKESIILSCISIAILALFTFFAQNGSLAKWLISDRNSLLFSDWIAEDIDTTLLLFIVMALAIMFYRFQERLIDKVHKSQSELLHAQEMLVKQNASLEQKIQERTLEFQQSNDVLSVLYRITDAVSSSKDIQELFTCIHKEIAELMFAENFFIALYDETTGLVSYPYFVDEKEPPVPTQPLVDLHGVTNYIIRTGNPIKHGLDQFSELVAKQEIQIVGAMHEDGIGAPLMIDHKIIGAIFMQCYSKDIHYTERDDEVLASVTKQIATALTRFRALESERRRSVELDIINSIQQGLAAELDSHAIVNLVGDKLHQIFEKNGIFISWYDEQNNLMQDLYSLEHGKRLSFESIPPSPGGQFEWMLKTRQPIICNTLADFSKMNIPVAPETDESKSMISVPIISSDRVLGMIAVENYEIENAFSQTDLRLLNTIAVSLGAALEKARLSLQKLETVESLRRSEEQYRLLAENSDDIIWTLDTDFRFTYISPAVSKLKSLDPEDLIHKSVYDIVSAEIVDPIVKLYKKNLPEILKGQDFKHQFDGKIIRGNGSVIWLEFSVKLVRDEKGDIIGFLGTARDVSERKKAEIAREESEHRMANIINFLPIASFVIDNNGIVTSWNQAMEKMTGIQREDILGKGNYEYALPFYGKRIPLLIDLISCSDKELEERYAHIRRQGDILMGEAFCENLGKKGSMLIGFASALYGSDGQIRGAIESIEDVTDLRQAEKELKEAKDAAEAANSSKSAFLANMSHEIRTPMNAILGFTQLMQRDSTLSAQQLEHLNVISRSGEHLLALINDILVLSKIEAGRSTFLPVNFNLHKLLTDMELMFRVRTIEKKIDLSVQISKDVPQWVITDEKKLSQVLINLIGNAVKFTEKGGIDIQVSRDQGPKRGVYLSFAVTDTGPGISAKEAKKLFQPFEQASSGLKMGGTGLGLALSQGFVKIMGGEINFSSKVGKGSVFRFTIPVKEGKEDVTRNHANRKKIIGLKSEHTGVKVLIADDRETNRQILSQMLLSVGFRTFEVTNGDEAVKTFRAWNPRVILMDMRMPVMDGFKATQIIRNEPQGKDCVIIAVTASAFQGDKQKILTSGADGYISKPFKEIDLFETIQKLTGVEYLYDEIVVIKQSTARRGSPNWNEAITALPVDLVRRCRNAAENADIFRLMELIKEITGIDAKTGRQLNDLAKEFSYEEIAKLLSVVE